MKKLASLLAVLFLVAAGFFAYRCHVAAERLRSIASGGEYRALGLKLTLSAPKESVKGLLRFQPYLEIPQVNLDASAWGLPAAFVLGPGRLKTGLWDNVGLRLILEGGKAEAGGFVFDGLAFELELPDKILSLRAKSLKSSRDAPEVGRTLLVQEPWLQLRPGEGEFPSQLNLRFEALSLENRDAQDRRQRMRVGVTELGYALTPEGEDWEWRAHFRGRGAASEGGKVQGDVGSWSFVANGNAAKTRELAAVLETAAWEKIPAALVRLRPRVDRLDFQWGGFEVKEGESWSGALRPLDLSVHYLPEEKGYGWKLSGRVQGASLSGKERRLELEGLFLEETLEYRDLAYADWLSLAARYYSDLFVARESEGDWIAAAARPFALYLAHLPDVWTGELGWKRLGYQAPTYRMEHRDWKLAFAAREEGWQYRVSGDFESHSDSGFLPSMKAAKLDFDLAFPLPYREVLAAARLQAETQPSEAWLQAFAGKEAGLDWKWKVDLGQESFSLHLELLAKTQLDFWLETLALFGLAEGPKPRRDLGQAFLRQGSGEFHLKVERLSRLQALLERVKKGSSLALALAGAYVVVDPKADTLSMELRLQEGEIHLNGRRSVSLESLLKKRLGAGK